jgi:hypothetical protein
MNETERDRILKMVSEGTLRPNEAAQLLAALVEEPPKETKAEKPDKEAEADKEKPKTQMTEVQMQRADGSFYTFKVPPGLFPTLVKVAGVEIKEWARSAAVDAWDGFKIMVRNKTHEVKDNVTARVRGEHKPAAQTESTPESVEQVEARRRIIQMVQNGRITATEAGRLIEQMDALTEYKKSSKD